MICRLSDFGSKALPWEQEHFFLKKETCFAFFLFSRQTIVAKAHFLHLCVVWQPVCPNRTWYGSPSLSVIRVLQGYKHAPGNRSWRGWRFSSRLEYGLLSPKVRESQLMSQNCQVVSLAWEAVLDSRAKRDDAVWNAPVASSCWTWCSFLRDFYQFLSGLNQFLSV